MCAVAEMYSVTSGMPMPMVCNARPFLPAEIIKINREYLAFRQAHMQTGFAAADFSRIRNAELARFTVDRLMLILNSLGAWIDVQNPRPPGTGSI